MDKIVCACIDPIWQYLDYDWEDLSAAGTNKVCKHKETFNIT